MGPSKERLRALQPFTVNVYENTFSKWANNGVVEEVIQGTWTLNVPYHNLYHDTFGLVDGDEPTANPEGLTV
jgi:hypothetical protein